MSPPGWRLPEPADPRRRLAFGSVAELYERRRPSYPAELVDEVLRRAGRPDRALEVGAGTGRATELFEARGVHVDALEPSREMAALARAKGFSVSETEFEAWRAEGEPYPLLYSAQAWHWIDPSVGYVRAREALQSGGLLAAFWNRVEWDRCALRSALQAVYERHAPELSADNPMYPSAERRHELWGSWEAAIDAGEGFTEPELRSFRHAVRYSAAEYVELLRTHSDHIVLGDGRREALLGAVGEAIGAAGDAIELPLVVRLCLARAR